MRFFAPDTVGSYRYFAPDDAPASLTSVTSDLVMTYAVRAAATRDLAQSYGIRSAVSIDLLASYSVLAGGAPALSPVSADLACAYSVRAAVVRDHVLAYAVRGRVLRDLVCSYEVLATDLPPDGSTPRPVTVAPSRTAQFASRSRVIVFNTAAPVSVPKVPADELYYVADVSSDLRASATTAQTVSPIPAGVTLLEGPAIQGELIVVKLGGFNTATSAKNFFTYRVTCANGEQFDRTIEFTLADDRSQVFGKDPDDRLLYAFDMGADATFGASALASVQSPVVVGVTALAAPVIQGNLAVIKIGGLDLEDDAENSYGLTLLFANGEKISRTIYFEHEEH